MRGKLLSALLLSGLSAVLVSFSDPLCWHKGGNNTVLYETGIDGEYSVTGSHSGTLRSVAPSNSSYGTLLQSCRPGSFAGKKIRMTAWLKTRDVVDWCGLWMRADEINRAEGSFTGYRNLSFDNMESRPVRGTTDWNRYEVVMDIPKNSTVLSFGAILSHTGQLWLDDIRLEVVDDSVLVTSLPVYQAEPWVQSYPTAYVAQEPCAAPGQLDFEE